MIVDYYIILIINYDSNSNSVMSSTGYSFADESAQFRVCLDSTASRFFSTPLYGVLILSQ